MDIAVVGMKKLRSEGKLADLDVSDEINACSIVVHIEIDGKMKSGLLCLKNETHNHPTEIEPFGGAATCLAEQFAIRYQEEHMCIRQCV